MTVQETILTRRSIRLYEEREIQEQDLMDIIEAGLYAPSSENDQPWYFVAITGKNEMKKLQDIMNIASERLTPMLEEKFEKHPKAAKEALQFIRVLGGAPVCILGFWLREDMDNKADNMPQNLAAAFQNMSLSAWAKGIGSCYLTAPTAADVQEEIRQIYAKEHGKLVAMMTFGYPKHIPKAPRRKDGRYHIVS